MDFHGNHHERRRDSRFEVNLDGALNVRDGSISVCIVDISLGGAQVKLLTAGHYSLENEIFSLSIAEYGTYRCAVVMRSDLIFRLTFTERPLRTSALAKFLQALS